MILLVAGLVLFIGIHLARVVVLAYRAEFIAERGDGPWKGVYSLVSFAGLALIVWGYATYDDPRFLYPPIEGTRGVALIAVPLALWLFVAANFPAGNLKRWVRHPMLIGTVIWATIHLANNGDLASVLLFGTFLVWASVTLVSSIVRPRKNPHAAPAGARTALWPDLASLAITVVLTWAFVAFLHEWLFGVAIVG